MFRFKFHSTWLLVLVFASLMSCQKETKEQLVGHWEFKNAVDPELQASFGELSETLGADVDVMSASSITNPYFENNYLRFEDNTCSVLLGVSGQALSGSWNFSAGDSLITINDKSQNEEMKIKVIALKEDELKVNLVTNDTTFNAGKIEITFVKAKK